MEQLQRRLTQLFHKACEKYSLIENNDHILVGLSGGKDSLALVELLGRRQRIFVPKFKVSAVYVQMENVGYKSDTEYLRAFCERSGVPFFERQTRFEYDESRGKSHCFLCSWYRRKTLFDTAKELGCNKLALGHHKDDIVETALLNLFFQGSFSSIAPKMQMDKFPLTLIRPLCLIEEKDLQQYAALSNYQSQEKLCPFEKESHRADMKRLVRDLERFNPNIRSSVMNALEY
ncbi:MAG: tRNA 2-thiocytidine(32) synthetase TtcA [Paludibacteraceae bacterium]|nr:tRNA 2-thiocytidine(32) synthetase TtcA [Paludibacteraceae bacterium]